MRALIVLVIVMLGFHGEASKGQKFSIESKATLETFQEYSKACKTNKVDQHTAKVLVGKFSARMDEWDVPALLVTRQYCSTGDLAEEVISKLSHEALMKHPKNLIQALIEEKVSADLLKRIADNNLADSKNCKVDCLKNETLAFEQRMEKVSNLELNTKEREMRDRLLSEMRVAFGKLKEKKFNE